MATPVADPVCVSVGEFVVLADPVGLPVELADPLKLATAVAEPVGLPVELAEDVPVTESAAVTVPELRGLVEYDGKDDAEASIVTDT